MRIVTNTRAMNTHRSYTINNNKAAKSSEKLSSGYRINRAGDDAAGLAISEKMRSQIRGLNMAEKNSQDAISLIQTAEGALQEVHTMLQRMNEIAVQSSTGTNQNIDREALDAEFQQLTDEINQISEQATFNNINLLDGTLGTGESTFTNKIDVGTTLSATTVITEVIQGASTNEVGAFTIAVGTVNTDGTLAAGEINALDAVVRVTFGTGTGATTIDINAGDVITSPKGSSLASLAANQVFELDLSGAGLGKYQMTTSAAVATADMDALISSFVTKSGVLVAGSGTAGQLTIQVGALEGETLDINVQEITSTTLGLDGHNILDQTDAQSAITASREAINTVSTQRGILGAAQNRLEYKIANLASSSENLSAAESRIREVDLAEEMTEFTKNNILAQAATAMLAQANAAPQNVLQLLQ